MGSINPSSYPIFDLMDYHPPCWKKNVLSVLEGSNYPSTDGDEIKKIANKKNLTITTQLDHSECRLIYDLFTDFDTHICNIYRIVENQGILFEKTVDGERIYEFAFAVKNSEMKVLGAVHFFIYLDHAILTIEGLGVVPEAKRQKIGSLLFLLTVAIAHSHKCRQINLQPTEEGNAFYTSFGCISEKIKDTMAFSAASLENKIKMNAAYEGYLHLNLEDPQVQQLLSDKLESL